MASFEMLKVYKSVHKGYRLQQGRQGVRGLYMPTLLALGFARVTCKCFKVSTSSAMLPCVSSSSSFSWQLGPAAAVGDGPLHLPGDMQSSCQ